MGYIPIDDQLQSSEELAEFFNGLITSQRTKIPKLSTFSVLMAKTRPGLDATVISTAITSRFNEASIPNGPLADGGVNSLEILMSLICEEMVGAIQDDMRVDVALDIGQQITSFGANAGGPITTQGSNINPWQGTGIGI